MKKQTIYTALFVLLFVIFPLDFYFIFKVAPTERIMGNVQRIFYLHVPLAISYYICCQYPVSVEKKYFLGHCGIYNCRDRGAVLHPGPDNRFLLGPACVECLVDLGSASVDYVHSLVHVCRILYSAERYSGKTKESTLFCSPWHNRVPGRADCSPCH